jgi:hypothetical protein
MSVGFWSSKTSTIRPLDYVAEKCRVSQRLLSLFYCRVYIVYGVTNLPISFIGFAEVRFVMAWRSGHPPPPVHSLTRAAASLWRSRRVCIIASVFEDS